MNNWFKCIILNQSDIYGCNSQDLNNYYIYILLLPSANTNMFLIREFNTQLNTLDTIK